MVVMVIRLVISNVYVLTLFNNAHILNIQGGGKMYGNSKFYVQAHHPIEGFAV